MYKKKQRKAAATVVSIARFIQASQICLFGVEDKVFFFFVDRCCKCIYDEFLFFVWKFVVRFCQMSFFIYNIVNLNLNCLNLFF